MRVSENGQEAKGDMAWEEWICDCEPDPSAEHRWEKEKRALHMLQGVRGSNPRRGTKKSLETQRFQGFSLFVHFLFVSNVLVT